MKLIYTLPLLIAVAACANRGANYQPVLDGEPTIAFQEDLLACQDLAHDQTHLNQEAKRAALVGAGIGAVLGEVDSSDDPWGGAIVGALAGGAAGAGEVADKRESMIVECLRGRGHRVVG